MNKNWAPEESSRLIHMRSWRSKQVAVIFGCLLICFALVLWYLFHSSSGGGTFKGRTPINLAETPFVPSTPKLLSKRREAPEVTELSIAEKDMIRAKTEVIRENFRTLELARTRTLQHFTEPGGSGLTVLISPPTDEELTSAQNFANQYVVGLSPLAATKLLQEVDIMVHEFDLGGVWRFVNMYAKNSQDGEVPTTKVKIGDVLDGRSFPDSFASGNFRLYNTKTTIGNEPVQSWRYGHIFKTIEVDSVPNAEGG